MNVRCPQCQTAFRVDPEKVPVGGVRARCARCSAVFALSRSGIAAAAKPGVATAAAGATQATAPAAPERPLAAPAPPVPVRATQATAPLARPPAAARVEPPPRPPAPPPPAPAAAPPVARAVPRPATPAPAPTPAPAAAGAAPGKRPSFTKQDPHTRAQRLARALVSDIVAYNKEKRDQTLAAGNMKNEFREEIRKSWEEYVAQVGLEMARGTTFFRDALNEILAKGEQVF